MSIENKKIYLASYGGLGNRIKHLVSGMILSEQTGYDIDLYWPINDHLSCKFEDLFVSPQFNRILPRDKTPAHISLKDGYSLWLNDKVVSFTNDSVVKNIITSFFKKLQIHSHIIDTANRFIETSLQDTKHIIGIHYRYDKEWFTSRGNLKTSIDYTDFFIQKMLTYDQDSTKFFISSANQQAIQPFMRFNNVICYNKQYESNTHVRYKERNTTAVIEALVDMYILSRCKEIIITPLSTFSECAWFFGDCKPLIYDPIRTNRYLII